MPRKKLKILLISDDAGDYQRLQTLLGALELFDCKLEHAANASNISSTAQQQSYDVHIIAANTIQLADLTASESLLDWHRPVIVVGNDVDNPPRGGVLDSLLVDYLPRDGLTELTLSRSLQHALDRGQLLRSDHMLQLAQRGLEATLNGVIIADARRDNFPIIFVNGGFERITGYSAKEVVGRNCNLLQGPETSETEVSRIRKALSEKSEVHVTLRNYRKDGTLFWNDLYIAPVPDHTGAITHFIGIQNDITDLKHAQQELAYNATHDALTGLANRTLFEDRLRQGLSTMQRFDRRMAVVFIDLDNFKPINDTMGHSVGDKVLIEVSRRLRSKIRDGDTIARIGGDEFVIAVLDIVHDQDVEIVVERLISALSAPYLIDDMTLQLTCSIGISLSDDSTENPLRMLQQADLAMYRAKQQGRNHFQWYVDELREEARADMQLRNALQQAMIRDELALHYQPQVDSASGRMVGMEALLRWNHPDMGRVSPDKFIPVAERSGQIISIGEWTLKTACRDVRRLMDAGHTGIVVSVNISTIQFQRSALVDRVHKILKNTGLPAANLELEITETVLLDNVKEAIITLHALKALGVGITIDDFGTGFSSLSYLSRLPIDKLKIDKSFINNIIIDERDAEITLGILSMAKHMKFKVIAEGVETEEQMTFLSKNGCHIIQGYYYAPAVPIDQIGAFCEELS